MRYYLDPTLARSNSMVFWFNANDDARKSVAGETYDSEQNYLASFSYPLPDELNAVSYTHLDVYKRQDHPLHPEERLQRVVRLR